MFPLKDFIARFRETLDALDELACDDALDADDAEALEDLNAEFEDMLLALEDIRPGAEGWRDELLEAADDLGAVLDDYDTLADRAGLAAIGEPVARARRQCAALARSLEEP